MDNQVQQIDAIMDGLRHLHITTPAFRALRDNLAGLFQGGHGEHASHKPVLYAQGTETRGVIMIAGPGAGKTTDMLHAVRGLKALQQNPDTGLPRYLTITVESPATLRSLASQFLRAMGIDRVSDRIKVHELWTLVRHRLKVLGVTLVVVDEAHDMFRSASVTEADAMFRMMKSLMQGEHPVVLLLGGTERLSAVTGLDAQVNRRFRKVFSLPLDIGADSDKIRKLIEFYAGKAGLDLNVRADLPARLIHGARCRFGRSVEITISAIETALRADDSMLTGEHFEVAWAMEEGCPLMSNVFAVDDFMAIELEDDDEIGERLRDAQASRHRTRAASKLQRKMRGG